MLRLLLLQQWQPANSQRQFLAWAATHWRSYFPRLLSQSAFNRRARQLYGVLAQLNEWLRPRLEAELAEAVAYEVMDGVPVRLMQVTRGRRHRSFGDEADLGHGGSDGQLYYGLKLLAVVDQLGCITGWVVGPASTAELWLAEALFGWRQDPQAPAPTAAALAPVLGPTHGTGGQRTGPTGPLRGRLSAGHPSDLPCLADLGFRGAAWRSHWRDDLGATVLLKSDYAPGPEQPQAVHWFNRLRHDVETTFSHLDDALHLQFPRARTYWGLLTRLAAKLTAYNLAVAFNYLHGRPTYALFNPLTA